MSFVARVPTTLSSSASESPEKKSYESQSTWSAKAEKNDRTGRPVVDRDVYSARYSRWDDDKAWSSQEWKADKSMDDRTVRPVVTSWGETHESQSSFFFMKTSTLLWKRKNLMIERGNPLCTLKEKQGNSNSSLEMTKQNQNCQWDPDHS